LYLPYSSYLGLESRSYGDVERRRLRTPKSVRSSHKLGGNIPATYHPLDSGYDHDDRSHTWHGPVPLHILVLCPTIPSRPGKGPDRDDLDMASQSTNYGEGNANANDEREDKQRQPKTFL